MTCEICKPSRNRTERVAAGIASLGLRMRLCNSAAACSRADPSTGTSARMARGTDNHLVESSCSSRSTLRLCSRIQVGVGCTGACAMGSSPWPAQGPFRCSQHRAARLFHQLYYLRRRFLAGDNGEDVISPPRQRPAPLGEIFRLVISASNTALMADVGEHALDNVRLDAELLVHNRAGKPSEVVQYKVWPRAADRRVERLAPRRPPLETATAPETRNRRSVAGGEGSLRLARSKG